MGNQLVQIVINLIIFSFSIYVGVKLHDFSRSKHVAPILARVKNTFRNNK